MKHLKSATEVERILAWRSDDFGNDTRALLAAESQALQEVGEDYLTLKAENEKLRAKIAFLYQYLLGCYVANEPPTERMANDARVALDEVSK